MDAKINKQKNALVITIPLHEPRESSSGKTLVVGSSSGPKPTAVIIDGKPVTVNVTAWIKKA